MFVKKQIFGQKNFGHKRFLGPEKNILVIIILCLENFFAQKIFLVQKILDSKKNFGPKDFWA